MNADRARDRPSLNACDDTFSMIRKGPGMMVSFLEGECLDVPCI